MKTFRRFGALALAALGAFVVIKALPAHAADEAKSPEALCPVMGDPVDPSWRLETADGPILFCCGKCPGRYRSNPAKYEEKVAALRKAMAQMPKVQVTCPLSGEPVDRKVFTEQDGEKVYFCCPKCKGKYEAAPDKYKTKLANSYSYQTKCPLSGEEIDPTAFVEFSTGQKVYFCCNKCVAKFKEDPAAQLDKLEAINVIVRAEDVKKDEH